jgi:tetratricopeptide (TPR) repeat protein
MDIHHVEHCIRVLGEVSRAIASQQNAPTSALEDGLSCIKAQGVLIQYAASMAQPHGVSQESSHRGDSHSFKDYVLRGSHSAMEHFYSGNHHMECMEFAEAVVAYEAAIEQNPSVPEFHFNKGNALARMQNYADAIVSYDMAIALRPDYAVAYANRGNCLYETQRFEEAVESFTAAAILNPSLANAYLGKGNALVRLNQLEAALLAYDQAKAQDPQLIEATYNKSIVLELMLLEGNAPRTDG